MMLSWNKNKRKKKGSAAALPFFAGEG
jgi:hypothetical protein